MSNNYGQHSAAFGTSQRKTWPFVGANYEGHTVTVRRDLDYDSFVKSIQYAFGAISTCNPNQIRLSATFDGLGGVPVQITPDLWAELLPELQIVVVTVECTLPGLLGNAPNVGVPGPDMPDPDRWQSSSNGILKLMPSETSDKQEPPYVWNGKNVYPHAGAREWAMYYLLGGTDRTGLVYFTNQHGGALTDIPSMCEVCRPS
ncbi:hypothetical protein BDV93DRAFT_562131 [Ceratobasidium sp. AG-I]|nr:hypothetical protein BDV93DRAFT_562131 [Ceratobasidium sp. AG-I]